MSENLEMRVTDGAKVKDQFGRAENQLKGTAGTLHLTNEDLKDKIMDAAINLAKATKLPAVIVVRL